jgi:multiple sugar transport system substrate-binding protein
MKHWKKFFSIGFICCLIVMLAACSGASNDSANGDVVTITYARGKDVTQGTKKLVDAFMKKHPNIKVNVKQMPADTGQNHDQLVTMLSSKSDEIDVIELDVIWPAEFSQAGYLQPLDRYIQKDQFPIDKYIKGGIEAGNVNGEQYAIPRFVDAGLLFYRKDLVKIPPQTWDELIAQAKQLKGKNGTKFGYLMQAKQYEGLVCNFIEFAGSYGGKILDDKGNVVVNSPETIKGLKKMIEITRSDLVPSNISTFMENESHTSFVQGESPFMRNWPYVYAVAQDKKQSKVVDKIDVAPLPKGDHDSVATLGGWMTGISKFSKHKKEAWEFIKFVSSPEGQKIAAQYGGSAPTYLPAYDDPDVQKASPLFANKNFVEGVSKAMPRPISPIYPALSDAMQVELSKAIVGKQSAEDTVKNIETKLKELLKK